MRLLPALVLLVACGRDQQPPPPGASVLIPERAPAHTPTTRPASLGDILVSDTRGASGPLSSRMHDVTALVFWASWCEPCQMEMPLVDRYVSSEHDPRVAIIAVNVDEVGDRQAALDAIAAKKLQLPVVFDPDEKVYAAAFKTDDTQIPALAIVSRDGIETEIGFDSELTDAQHVAHFRELVHAHVR
jgi:thiol-disulfide isomerase/thioredoxin